jgi:hypothetical protein
MMPHNHLPQYNFWPTFRMLFSLEYRVLVGVTVPAG